MNDSHLHHKAPYRPDFLGVWFFSAALLVGTFSAQAAEKQNANTPEPQVKARVLEDAGSRIEELSLRGHTQRIVVTPKSGALQQPYEIITGDGSRDLSPGVNTSRGAAGQRVWRVWDF